MSEANDQASAETSGGHLMRWLILVAIAMFAVAMGRKMAIDSADKKFEERLAALDNRQK